MSASPGTALLTRLDSLAYPARARLLASHACRLPHADLRELLGELWSGDTDHRHIALTMGVAARDGRSVRTGLADTDRGIVARSLRAAVALGVETPRLTALLDDAPAGTRARLYRLARNDTPLAEAIIGPVRARYGDREAARVLPGCEGDTVARLLPELSYALTGWKFLAGRHPGPVLDEAGRLLAEFAGPARDAWWSRRGRAVLTTARHAPEDLLALLERHPGLPAVSETAWAVGLLAVRRPERVVRLLTDPAQTGLRAARSRPSLLRRIAGLDTVVLTGFAHALDGDGELAALLDALPPSRRSELFDAVRPDLTDPIGDPLLSALPHARQTAEARRCLALPQIAQDAGQRLWFTARLPFEEAFPAIAEATRSHRAEERAEAYRLLFECAVRSNDPTALGTALGALGRLRNEQDPVRESAVGAIAAVPAHRFEASHLATLEELATGVAEARDASWMTLDALGRLATTVLAERGEVAPLRVWATRTLDRLFANRMPPLPRLDRALRRGQEHAFAEAVLPWLTACADRAHFDPLFAVANALGKRARGVRGLQALLRRAVSPRNLVPVMLQGIRLWLDDPATRDTRVEEVVGEDSSTVAMPPVWNILSARRTDLLDLVLPGPPHGRLIAEGAPWVPSIRFPGRMLPRQRDVCARLLAEAAADAGAQRYSRVQAIHAVADVPGGDTVVSRYLGSPDVVLAEAALAALAHTGDPEHALDVSLTEFDGDRARVAAYAAGRAASFVHPSRLGPKLTGALADGRKVTSRKEAARLLSRLAVPAAMDALAAAWRPGTHRDVKAAIVSAVRLQLDDPRAWQILDDAVAGDETAVATAVLAIGPLDTAPRHRTRYGGLVSVLCAHPRPLIAVAAWAAYPSWAPWAPEAGGLLVGALADLDERVHWRIAARSLAAMLHTAPDSEALEQAVAGLLDAEAADTRPEACDRDRPSAQRLDALVSAAVAHADTALSPAGRAALARAGGILAERPDHLAGAARLLIASSGLTSAVPGAIAEDLASVADLLAGRPVTASRVAGEILAAASRRPHGDARAFRPAAETLAERGDLPAGLFALALADGGSRVGSGRRGADPPWRDLLLRLRGHAEAEVRAAALALFTTQE
ncbi:hypothetical protein AB0I28_01890 [Phytomonospora sp. NPDC050363]|uniref:hypothetical protein n=1 Tax=Phytomonospora sp. NPDC050363 TaxID=3155642 RepID=UPI0033DBAEBB